MEPVPPLVNGPYPFNPRAPPKLEEYSTKMIMLVMSTDSYCEKLRSGEIPDRDLPMDNGRGTVTSSYVGMADFICAVRYEWNVA